MNRISAALLLASVGMAVIAQYLLTVTPGVPADGLLLFLAAIILFCYLFWRQERPGASGDRLPLWGRLAGVAYREPVRATLVGLSFLLAYLTLRMILGKVGNDSYWDAFAVWTLGCLTYALAFLPWPLRFGVRTWLVAHRVDLAWALGLFAAGALMRFIALGSIPDVISGDEGVIGNLAQSAARGEITDMFASAFGHSTLYIMLMGWSVDWFGNNAFGLRLLNAIGGSLTVPAVYILARRMFDRRVAIVAGVLIAVSHLHVHFSRIIVAGSVMDALFATLAFWLLYEGLARKNAFFFVLSGLTVGLHLYIYMGARLLVILLPVYFLALIVLQWPRAKIHLPRMAALGGALAVSGPPMALWATLHPDEFMARANQVGIFQTGWLANESTQTGQPVWLIFPRLVLDAFLSVTHYPAEAFYRSTYPMLDFAAAVFFFLGLGYSLLRIRDERFLMLNGWFWSGVVVGGALVVLPALSAYRILMVLPAVVILVAIGVTKTITLTEQLLPVAATWPLVAIGVFLLVSSAINLKAYWVDWAPKCQYEDAATRFASQMGSYLAAQPRDTQVILLGEPFIHYGIHQSIDFLDGKLPVQDLLQPLDSPPTLPLDARRTIVFVATPMRAAELAYVRPLFSYGRLVKLDDCGRASMFIYQVTPP